MQIGSPLLDTTVEAKVVGNGKRKKIRVIKFKRRKNYQRNKGHRQQFTEIPAAEPAAPPTTPASAPAPQATGAADDLTEINGIGPIIRDQLIERGITTFAQIAAFTAAEIESLDEDLSFPGRSKIQARFSWRSSNGT